MLPGSAGHCVVDKTGRDVLGFGELEVEGQQVKAFGVFRRFYLTGNHSAATV